MEGSQSRRYPVITFSESQWHKLHKKPYDWRQTGFIWRNLTKQFPQKCQKRVLRTSVPLLQTHTQQSSVERSVSVSSPRLEELTSSHITNGAYDYRDNIWKLFFFNSVQTLPFIHCSCCTHLSHDGPPYPISQRVNAPFVKTGGIHCEGLSGMRGLRSGWRFSLAANPRWRSDYLWRCVLWWHACLWGCGIARLRSSTFAVERRKCISGTIYSPWDNSCVPHGILLLVHFSSLQYSDFCRHG